MASRFNIPYWEVPKFSFQSSLQSEDWKAFYTRVLDYLEVLNINTNEPDDTRIGWTQLKMMFEGKDWQILQILLDNNTITP